MLRSIALCDSAAFQEHLTWIVNLAATLTANPQPQSAMLPVTSTATSFQTEREDLSEYVAHLQLHMALQARNLVPTLTQTADSRQQMLHQTQADFEKYVSRQSL
jgi:hypothetical protein